MFTNCLIYGIKFQNSNEIEWMTHFKWRKFKNKLIFHVRNLGDSKAISPGGYWVKTAQPNLIILLYCISSFDGSMLLESEIQNRFEIVQCSVIQNRNLKVAFSVCQKVSQIQMKY